MLPAPLHSSPSTHPHPSDSRHHNVHPHQVFCSRNAAQIPRVPHYKWVSNRHRSSHSHHHTAPHGSEWHCRTGQHSLPADTLWNSHHHCGCFGRHRFPVVPDDHCHTRSTATAKGSAEAG